MGEAIVRLQALPWVRDVYPMKVSLRFTTTPGARNPLFIEGYAGVLTSTIRRLTVRTRLRFGDLWRAFGRPRAAGLDSYYHTVAYENFYARLRLACRRFWHQTVDIIVTEFDYETRLYSPALWQDVCLRRSR